MKTIDEYMKLPYRLEIIPDLEEGGFVASYPELPGCFSSGQTIEEAVVNVNEAKKDWLATALEDGYPVNEPVLSLSFDEK